MTKSQLLFRQAIFEHSLFFHLTLDNILIGENNTRNGDNDTKPMWYMVLDEKKTLGG